MSRVGGVVGSEVEDGLLNKLGGALTGASVPAGTRAKAEKKRSLQRPIQEEPGRSCRAGKISDSSPNTPVVEHAVG